MRASVRQQQLLLQLQEHDVSLLRLKRTQSQLPQLQELADLDVELAHAKDRLMTQQRQLDTLNADITRLENDIETVRARRERDTDLLLHSSSPKEAVSLQTELDVLAVRKDELEEREMMLLEQQETAQAAFDEAAQMLANVDNKRSVLTASLNAERDALDKLIQEAAHNRSLIAAEVERDLLEHYENLRTRTAIAVARLRGNVSEASNLELAPAELSDIADTPDDELVYCPQTGAILVRQYEN